MCFRRRIALCVALTACVWIGACSNTPTVTSVATNLVPASAEPSVAPQASSAPAPVQPVQNAQVAPYLDPNNQLFKERSVYFDFDQSTIKQDYAQRLESQGMYLAAHPDIAIKIEGNTDELGSAEYNLALGQKRAQAVLKTLKLYGVRESQLEAVSYGKEKPRALGHDEVARSQNRRADLLYPLK